MAALHGVWRVRIDIKKIKLIYLRYIYCVIIKYIYDIYVTHLNESHVGNVLIELLVVSERAESLLSRDISSKKIAQF